MARLGLALVVAALCSVPKDVRAAVMVGAHLLQRGAGVEMRFEFRQKAPRWSLSTHRHQLWIDLDRTRLEIPPRPLYGREVPPVLSVRAVSREGGRARLMIEVGERADYAIARIDREIVVRIAPAGKAGDLAASLLAATKSRHKKASGPARRRTSGASKPVLRNQNRPSKVLASAVVQRGRQRKRTSATAARLRPRARGPLVMVDPGHGGPDPGTRSASGLKEKDLALRISLRLRRELEALGIRSALTRTGDEFLSLAERTRIANNAKADLFISIHLNSSPNTRTAGIEVYYLNNTTDRATIRLARMENAEADGYGAPGKLNLNYILTDLRQQYKAAESASLARMIGVRTTALLGARLGLKVNELGARKGPFYVLVGARMPAVLVECGFLSNPREARRLASPSYQAVLARGIAMAAAEYFDGNVATGNL